MKQILIAVICVVCAATLMAGCLGAGDEPADANEPTILNEPSDDESSIISNVVESTTDSKSDDLDAIPITVMLAGMTTHEVDLKRYILLEDNSMELCSIGEYRFGTWKLYDWTSTTRTYIVSTKEEYALGIFRTNLIIRDDGTAELVLRADKSYCGTWAEGIDRSRGACDPRASIDYLDVNDYNPEGLPVPPVVVTLDLISMGTAKITLDEDRSAELCTTISDNQCETGEWHWLSDKSRAHRTYDLVGCCEDDFSVTLYKDGRAVGKQLGMEFEGTWEKQ